MSSRSGRFTRWGLVLGILVIPMALAIFYYTSLAADRYVSTAQVVVRQDGSSQPSQLGGMAALLGGANPASREETLYLREYIVSMDMMLLLNERLGWIAQYAQQTSDPLFLVSTDTPREEQLEYYQRLVTAHYDEMTGLLRIEVQGFTPELSHEMLQTILEASERFVNEMSHSIAREQMRFALGELEAARERYELRSDELLRFQAANNVLDGQGTAASRASIIATLEAEYTKEQAALTQLLYKLRDDSPQVRQQRQRINAIRDQLAREQRRLLSNPDGDQLNVVASQFQRLTLEAGMAEEAYKLGVAAVENARIETSKKIRTLVTVVSPNRPDSAVFPERLYNLATIALALLLIFGITHFVIASIEDHRD